MKYILRQRRHVYDGIKEVYLFLDKHVKSEKGHVLWYIHSIGEWETCQKKDRYYGSYSFWYYNQKKHHLDSCASVDGSTLAKKDYAGRGI